MSLAPFQLLRPRTLPDALGMLQEHSGSIRVLAGGTDLLPSMRQKLFEPKYVLDLRRLDELNGIRETEQGIEIGAVTTLHEIEHSELLRERYPVLVEAAETVASPVLRNMGTIGGNICLDTRCLWYNQSLAWRKSCGFCIKKDGDLCHVAPGGTKCCHEALEWPCRRSSDRHHCHESRASTGERYRRNDFRQSNDSNDCGISRRTGSAHRKTFNYLRTHARVPP